MARSDRLPGFSSETRRQRFLAAYDRALERLWPVAVDAEDVGVTAGTVRVYRAGPRGDDPFVLLTGAGGNALAWYGWIQELARHRPVIAVDPLGEPGRSVQTRPVYGAEAAAGWVEELLAAVGAERAHLVGVSWGGYLALQHQVRHPGRVEAVSLLEPAGFSPVSARLMRWLIVTGLAAMVLPRSLRHRAARRLGNRTLEQDELVRVMRAGVGFRRPVTELHVFTDDELAAVRPPVQVLLGSRSVLHDSAAVAARLAGVVPGWRVEVVPGAGHAVVMDEPELALHRVLGFLPAGEGGR